MALDRPATGIHAVAGAVLAAKGATAEDLALARAVLLQDPGEDSLPAREAEAICAAFNRQTDAVIDAVDRSRRRNLRSARRVDLAEALDQAGLTLLDKAVLADLLAPKITVSWSGSIEPIRGLEDPGGEFTIMPSDVDGHDLGEELLEGTTAEAIAEEAALQRAVDDEQARRIHEDPLGLSSELLEPLPIAGGMLEITHSGVGVTMRLPCAAEQQAAGGCDHRYGSGDDEFPLHAGDYGRPNVND